MNTIEIEKEVEEYMESGLYPVVDEHLFDKVYDYKPSTTATNKKDFLLEEYNEYLQLLTRQQPEILEAFLTILKNYDIKDNQKLEREQEFLIDIQNFLLNPIIPHAIDFLMESKDKPLTKENMKMAHGLLMEGTSNITSDNYLFRKHNNKVVGTYKNGERIIYYFPPKVEKIEILAEKFLEYYNDENLNKDIFTTPIIAHGLLATMQIFDDGNTRLARLLQHAKLHKQTNEVLGYDFKLPIIYNTRTYYPQRGKYREFTVKMATNATNEVFDEWCIFNYNLFLNQIYKSEEKVRQLSLIR